MDTRSKILPLEQAAAAARGRTVVTGTFDVLLAGHARELARLRNHAALLAIVAPSRDAVLPAHARAEMVAALGMVDYVVVAQPDGNTLEEWLAGLDCAAVVRLEGNHRRQFRQLEEHVRRRQTG